MSLLRPKAPNPNQLQPQQRHQHSSITDPEQLSQLEINLLRFEEERRKFEQEKKRFELERRELDRVRLRRLEERDKKRIAEGYQQLLALKVKERRPSAKVSDPEECQKLIESFNKAQEISLVDTENVSPSRQKKSPPQPDIVASNNHNNNARRSESFTHQQVGQGYDSSPISNSEEDTDNEYVDTEAKSFVEMPKTLAQCKMAEAKRPGIIGRILMKFQTSKNMYLTSLNLKANDPGRKVPRPGNMYKQWQQFKEKHQQELAIIRSQTRKCIANLIILIIICGFGAFIFRYLEGSFENFYKCGVKKVKRDFVDSLWSASHNMR